MIRKWLLAVVASGVLAAGFVGCGDETTPTTKTKTGTEVKTKTGTETKTKTGTEAKAPE